MTVCTYQDAYSIARQHKDRVMACKTLCSLLWHVDASEGGFIGLSDAELEAKCAGDRCLSYAAAVSWQYAPPPWPEAVSERAAA